MNIARLMTQSGRSKAGFLSDQALLREALMVGVCETWLEPSIMDSEVLHNFTGYSIFRGDRTNRQGGGVALYLNDKLSGDTLASFDNSVCQAIVVMVHQTNTCVVVCYRPPDTRVAEFNGMIETVETTLAALPTPVPNIVIMGDFNLPRSVVQWQRSEEGNLFPLVAPHREGETAGGKQDRLQAHRLMELAAKYFMQQEVDMPTHAAECIDLIFTNNCDLVSGCQTENLPLFSDHKLVIAHTTFHLNEEREKLEQQYLCPVASRYNALDYNKAPWAEVETKLGQVDWKPMDELSKSSPDDALAWFHDKLLPILEEMVPKKKIRLGKPCSKMHRMRRLLWRKLAKVDSKLKVASTMHKKSKLLAEKWKLEEQLQSDYTSTNNAEEDEVVFRMKENPKAFFSFARARQTTRAKVGPFMDPSSSQPNASPDYCCSALKDQYDSVFAKPRQEWQVKDLSEHFKVNTPDHENLTDVSFSRADIEAACLQLSAQSAAGPDGVPAALLKMCRKSLSLPLFLLWRGSMDCGVIPAETLLVTICPIHKGGSRSLPKQYRPVALTSHLIKVFERVVRLALVEHIERHGLLPDGQHGSRAKRSTLTQLMAHWDSILDGLKEGNGVDCVYLDFSKAFDKVETGVLLHKLKSSKVQGRMGVWLGKFLDPATRKQAVAVEGRLSDLSPVISGVPQGTVLGPILFLLHISSIAREVSPGTHITSYVDDTRANRSIADTSVDCAALQSDLEAIYRWAEDVNMVFNSDKFELIRYWPRADTKPDTSYTDPAGNIIEEKDHLRDLGVEMTNDLTFNLHIENVVAGANKLVGWALRTFRRRSRKLMLTIWKSLVQSKLDYCSQLWSPNSQGSIAKLESVARNFTAQVAGLDGLDYWERLVKLQMYSQERRRERYENIYIWKVSQHKVQG